MNKTFLGLAIIAVVAGGALAVQMLDIGGLTREADRHSPVSLAIYYGGEKSELLQDKEIRDIIERRYKVSLTAVKAGSIEMATTLASDGKECLWPSNGFAVDLARQSGKSVVGSETVFNSPIVLYAWAEVADALQAKGVVTAHNDGTYTADTAALLGLMEQGARWKEDLGLPIYGRFQVFSTDPVKSNSGNIWAGLLATAMNEGEPPRTGDLGPLLPRLSALFGAMGYKEASSGDIFDNFLKQGMGARPIIVGYENQLVEFLTANAQHAQMINDKVRVIYPEPTSFASHPLIFLDQSCARLSEALADPELQKLAWIRHGFRTGLLGVQNDPADLAYAHIPETVSNVAPMPPGDAMLAILDALR